MAFNEPDVGRFRRLMHAAFAAAKVDARTTVGNRSALPVHVPFAESVKMAFDLVVMGPR